MTSGVLSLRSVALKLGSPIMPVAPPTRAIGLVAGFWKRFEDEHRHQMAEVQAVCRRVEAAIEGDRLLDQQLVERFRIGQLGDRGRDRAGPEAGDWYIAISPRERRIRQTQAPKFEPAILAEAGRNAVPAKAFRDGSPFRVKSTFSSCLALPHHDRMTSLSTVMPASISMRAMPLSTASSRWPKKTLRDGVLGGIGGFGALFEVPKRYRSRFWSPGPMASAPSSSSPSS